MLELNATAQFRRDRRLCVKRGYDMGLLNAVVDTLCIRRRCRRKTATIFSPEIIPDTGNAIFNPIGC